jgi:hypothetical protein
MWELFARNCLCFKVQKRQQRKKFSGKNIQMSFIPLPAAIFNHSWDYLIKQVLFFYAKIAPRKPIIWQRLWLFFPTTSLFCYHHSFFISLCSTNVLHNSQKKKGRFLELFHCATNHFTKFIKASWFFFSSLLNHLQVAFYSVLNLYKDSFLKSPVSS